MSPRPWIVAAVLAISIGAVYGRALNVPFVYDDRPTIVENKSITVLWPLIGTQGHPGPLNPAPDLPTSGRPLVNLSFAINYAFGGLDPVGYHTTNVVIHFLASLLVWAIVRRTLLLPYFAGRFATSAGWLAFAVAMLWALHPLQTEAVIFATQRTELMMAVFYLATLYCSVRYWLALPNANPVSDGAGERSSSRPQRKKKNEDKSAAAPHRTVWLTLAIIACLAGMASKEVMVSAPLMMLLFDRTFVSGSLPNALRRSWPLYAGLATTWILLLLLMLNAPHGASAGFALRIPAYVWWLTQSKVVLMYLKLAAWPWPLLLYYELPLIQTFGEAWMYVLPVLVLGIGTLVLLWRNHPVGYLGTWVFAILAPTSLVPIVTEMAAERRMYLPLVAIVILAVAAGWLLMQRRGDGTMPRIVFPAFLVALVFALVDIHRLDAYHDEMTLWREVIQRQPENVVAHNNLGDLLIRAGRSSEAIVTIQDLLALKPDQPVALNNLGVALSEIGRYKEAAEKLQQAVQLRPDYADAHNGLGRALTNIGQHQQAIEELQTALKLQPNNPKPLFNLGVTFTNLGKYPEAIEYYERALELEPTLTDARVNIGVVLSMSGKVPQAIEQFQQVLIAAPNDINAHNNLGLLFSDSGQADEAIRHFEQALRVDAKRSDIHSNLAQVYKRAGRTDDAIKQFQAAVRLKPDDAQSFGELAQMLALANRSQEAIATAEKAIEVARATNQQAAAGQMEAWLQQYRAELQRTK